LHYINANPEIEMQPRLEILEERKLVGLKTMMSLFTMYRTSELWQSFMPRRKEIQHIISPDFYSLEVYPQNYFDIFDLSAIFEKWAAIEVSAFDQLPEGMEPEVVPAGRFAVFPYKGLSSDAAKTYQYIFGTWLPNSIFVLDDRPHLAVMGQGYRNNDPASEEDIWVPVKPSEKKDR